MAGALVDLAQPAAQVFPHAGVERAERLVQQQHARLDRQRPRQRHALPLTAGELRGETLLEARELHEVEQLHHLVLDVRFLRLVLAPRAQAERDVVHHPHVLEQGIVLEHEADAAILNAALRSVAVVEIDHARIRRLEARDRAQQRRLARARRAQKRDKLARLHSQRHVIERRHVGVVLGDILGADLHTDHDSVTPLGG